MGTAGVRSLIVVSLLTVALALACGGGDDAENQGRPVPLREIFGGGEPAPTPESSRPARVEPAPTDPALQAYAEAKNYVIGGNLDSAREALNRAVAADPQFAEAWYQLGATETNMAIEAVNADEDRAVQLFRDGVDHKRTAEGLMRQGAYRVWTPPQQEEAWNDLQQGLEGVDELLADEATLVQALRMYAGGAR